MSENRCNPLISWWFITETRNSMSTGMNLCLIWILYGYSWRTFFKILCNDARERPSYWESLQRDFYGLLRTESFIASTLSGYLSVNFYWPCGLKFVYPMINLAFLGIIAKVHLPAKFYLHSFEWFCLQISSDAKYFFLSCPRHCDKD